MDEKSMYDRLVELRELVRMEDIPSPTVPEYIEHHESIQKILKLIDERLAKPTIENVHYRITTDMLNDSAEAHYIYCAACEMTGPFTVLVDSTITIVFCGQIFNIERIGHE